MADYRIVILLSEIIFAHFYGVWVSLFCFVSFFLHISSDNICKHLHVVLLQY